MARGVYIGREENEGPAHWTVRIGKDTWSELKTSKQGKAVINGGWRWGWLFSGSCGPLLKEQPGQVRAKALGRGMRYLGETEKTDTEVEQWNTRFLKEKPTREQSSAEYAISLTSWLLGPNAVLKQLVAVEEDQKNESVVDEFEDCQVDQLEEEDNKDEDMNRSGLVAFVKDRDDDEQVDTDVDDPNYTPPAEKTDTEDDFSEEDDEGNESDAEEDDQVKHVNEMKMCKEEEEGSSSDERSDEEGEKKKKMKRSIFGKKRSLPIGQSSESDLKKRKSSFDIDEDDMEEEEGHTDDGLEYSVASTGQAQEEEKNEKVHFEYEEEEVTGGTQKSILEAAEESLYDDLEDEEMYEKDDFKRGRQDQRVIKGNVVEDDSSYQSDAEEEEEEEVKDWSLKAGVSPGLAGVEDRHQQWVG